MEGKSAFRCEVTKADKDLLGNKVTTVKCHGRLISGGPSTEVKDVVKPLIPEGGRIVVDLGEVEYLDSSGLGALVGLKVSAIKQGYCTVEFEHMTPRVMELLRVANLVQVLGAKGS